MSKKVLIITQNFYPVIGSSGNRNKNLYQLLNENGIDADVLTTEPAYPNKNMYKDSEFWDDESLNNEKRKIIRVPIKNNRFQNHILSRLFFYIEIMYRFLLQLWKIRGNKYDYILVSTPPIFIVFSAWIGKFLLKSKIILEVRDLWPDSLVGVNTFNKPFILKVFRFFETKMYRMADSILINSQGFHDHIQSKLKKKTDIIYIPNGPRLHEIAPEKLYEGEFRVVYTGNIGLAQDITNLKKIAKLLHDASIRFDVIGYGVKVDVFREFILKEQLDHVHMHKPTTRKKSLELIENSSVAVAFLNDAEVFSTVLPGKIIDYMTGRTPVIAGVKGTAADLITKNQVGYVFDQKEVQAMVDKIIELKNNKQQLEQLEENCVKTVTENFLWENNIKKLIEIIK